MKKKIKKGLLLGLGLAPLIKKEAGKIVKKVIAAGKAQGFGKAYAKKVMDLAVKEQRRIRAGLEVDAKKAAEHLLRKVKKEIKSFAKELTNIDLKKPKKKNIKKKKSKKR